MPFVQLVFKLVGKHQAHLSVQCLCQSGKHSKPSECLGTKSKESKCEAQKRPGTHVYLIVIEALLQVVDERLLIERLQENHISNADHVVQK